MFSRRLTVSVFKQKLSGCLVRCNRLNIGHFRLLNLLSNIIPVKIFSLCQLLLILQVLRCTLNIVLLGFRLLLVRIILKLGIMLLKLKNIFIVKLMIILLIFIIIVVFIDINEWIVQQIMHLTMCHFVS